MAAVALIAVLIVVVGAKFILTEGAIGLALRDILRAQPAARRAWIADGKWAKFSRRFGLGYAAALVAAGFLWMLIGPAFVPDTSIGAWLIVGPSIASIAAGVALGMLRAARWAGDL